MKENTFDFFEPRVTEITCRMENGYYTGHGLSSIKEDISRMCRDVMKRQRKGVKDDHFNADDSCEAFAENREWGARMTEASLVPPVTRKNEVLDHYVIVADQEEVERKMQVSLPDEYKEKLDVQKSGADESDMENPEVKDYKPRKQLGDEVLEQEVYGIDPYTHNLLLDSMPEELDWPLSDKLVFIEDVFLRTLNKQARTFTGTEQAPMKY